MLHSILKILNILWKIITALIVVIPSLLSLYLLIKRKSYKYILKDIINIYKHMKNKIEMQEEKLICVILAGGYAHRLFPLTNNMAKTLLPIAGTSSLEMIIKKVEKIPAIEKIVLLVNISRQKEINNFVEDYLGNTKGKSAKIEIFGEPENEEKEKWGPMRALWHYYNEYDKPKYNHWTKDHLIIGGDNIFDFDLTKFLKHIKTKGKNYVWIALYDNEKAPNRDIDIREVGTVGLNEKTNEITCFYEKDESQKCKYIATACYYIPSEKLILVEEYFKNAIINKKPDEVEVNDNLGKFISFIIKNGVRGYSFTEKWLDIGLRETLLAANTYVLKKIRKKAEIIFMNKNVFHEPILIGKKCSVLEPSKIGPNVYIAENCVIKNCEIEDSIIMQNTIIRNSVIKKSIIGPGSIIEADIYDSVFGPKTQCYGPHTR